MSLGSAEELVVDGPAGRAVALEALDRAAASVPLGRIGPQGTLTTRAPTVPPGR